jgi:putative addiction module component (TIGR02574 family)
VSTRAELVEELLKLPASERAEAALALLESLDDGDAAEVETAWRDEIARRVVEIKDGSVELQDGPTAMRAFREKVRARVERSK